MRLDIKTKGKIKDKDIKALYIINRGLEMSSNRMRLANLGFVLSKWGYEIKQNQHGK